MKFHILLEALYFYSLCLAGYSSVPVVNKQSSKYQQGQPSLTKMSLKMLQSCYNSYLKSVKCGLYLVTAKG